MLKEALLLLCLLVRARQRWRRRGITRIGVKSTQTHLLGLIQRYDGEAFR